MNENVCILKEHSETPYLIFRVGSGEILQGNRMARAFYSVDKKKLTVYDVLLSMPKGAITSKVKTYFEYMITQKANGVKYVCNATIDTCDREEVASLEVELLQDCLVEPLKKDIIQSKLPEFILHYNENLNIYFANNEFYKTLNTDVEKIHKENKNSFLNLIPKKTRKYFVEQIKKYLFQDVNILQIQISLLHGKSQIITFKRISDKLHGQITDYEYTQRDLDLIRKRFALIQFQFSDIKDFNSGLSKVEKENGIDSFIETGLKEVISFAKVIGKVDKYHYSLILELSYYSIEMGERQIEAVINHLLESFSRKYGTETEYFTAKASIGYALSEYDGNDFDRLKDKSLTALACSQSFETNVATRYTAGFRNY